MAVAILQRRRVDVDDGALATLLAVVDPAYDGHHAIEKRPVVHAVGAMEVGRLRIMGGEQSERVDQFILIAKQSPYALLLALALVGVHGLERGEALFGYFLVLLLERLGHHKFLLAVLSWVGPHLLARHTMAF